MFLPTESLLSEALSTDPTLLEDALRLGVAPTSPSSLLALLRAVASVWSSAHVAEQAEEIAALGTTLIDRLTVVASHLDSLGNSLRSSVRHYNKVVGSLESRVLVTARDFSALDRTVKSPAPISSDDAQVRQIVASELTENQQLGASASHEPYGDGPDERPSL